MIRYREAKVFISLDIRVERPHNEAEKMKEGRI